MEGSNTYAVFYKSNLKSAKTYKSPWVLPSSKTAYYGISKLIMQCPYSFRILCDILFPFFFVHLKVCTVHSRTSSLFCKRSIIGQLNIPAATAENEEQYTYSNIIYIGFQNSYSFLKFSLISIDKQLFLKGRQINWKILVVEFIFCQSCRLRACNFTKKALS